MDGVTQFLVLFAGVILVGALGEMAVKRTGIPDVIWLIGVGILLGPVFGFVTPADLATVTPGFAAITLIVVLFEGGSRIVIGDLLKAAPRAALLSVTGFIITVVGVALVSWLAGLAGLFEDWSLLHGVMLGAIVGGSSSLIIMPSMAIADVDDDVSNLVGIESALTDALCVVVTLAMISIIVSGEGSTSGALATLGTQFGIALVVGVVAGWTWMPVMRMLRASPHAYPVTLSALVVLYVIVESMGGSAALGILAFAVVVGNAPSIIARVGFAPETPLDLDDSVRATHSNVAFFVKSLFFTFIGLMIGPPWGFVFVGVLLAALLLALRVPAVWLATRGAGFSRRQQRIVTVSLPRGMAAGVLATIPLAQGVSGTDVLPPMVFACVAATILIFAVGFPIASRTPDDAEPVEVVAAIADDVTPEPGPEPPLGLPDGAGEAVEEVAGADVEATSEPDLPPLPSDRPESSVAEETEDTPGSAVADSAVADSAVADSAVADSAVADTAVAVELPPEPTEG